MKIDKRRHRNTLWDTRVVTRKEHYASIAGRLAAFAKHKNDLLAHLRKACERSPKSEPFDADAAWRHLSLLAEAYFWQPIRKQETLLPARRVDQLRDLAKALGRAHRLADKALQDDVGYDLFRAWVAGANIPLNDDGLMGVIHEIKKVVESVATLEAAANRAARHVPTKAGAPRGTGILPPDYITALEERYRRSSGLEPKMDAEPFAEFVGEFLTAVGPVKDPSEDYVFEALKYARRQARKHGR